MDSRVWCLCLFLAFSFTTAQEICDKCTCHIEASSVDCTGRNLTLAFNRTELWRTPQDGLLQVLDFNFHNNHVAHIFPFPKLGIVKLDLSGNHIVKIESESFTLLQDMVELDLSDNSLMSEYLTSDVFKGPYAPEDTEPMRSLKILRLSKNALHTLHQDLFEHTDRIEILMLDSNPFSVIDRVTLSAISSLPHLRILDLSHTNIKTLPPYMLHTPKYLTHLNLTGNDFEELPKTLEDVHQLQWLSLSNNPIQSLEGSNIFPQISSLTVLHMADMPKLTKIGDGALSGLTGLSRLHLNNNPALRAISPSALSRLQDDNSAELSWPPITVLKIDKNNLTTVSSHLLGHWQRLDHLDIRYNSWSCDCENQWIIETLIPIIQGMHDGTLAHGVKCSSPVEMVNRNLTELSEHGVKMRCLDLYGNRPERDGSLLIGILIGVLLTVPIMMALLMFCYRRNFFGVVQVNRGPAEYSRTFYKRADMSDENYI